MRAARDLELVASLACRIWGLCNRECLRVSSAHLGLACGSVARRALRGISFAEDHSMRLSNAASIAMFRNLSCALLAVVLIAGCSAKAADETKTSDLSNDANAATDDTAATDAK